MKKKTIIIGSLVILLLVIGIILLLSKKEEVTDENILYSVNFNNVVLRFKHVDNVTPQNQIVTVEKSIDNGKTFDVITEEGLTVSLEPKFIFLNEQLGFAVKKSNNTKENGKYYGMYVTVDGGKTFTLSGGYSYVTDASGNRMENSEDVKVGDSLLLYLKLTMITLILRY